MIESSVFKVQLPFPWNHKHAKASETVTDRLSLYISSVARESYVAPEVEANGLEVEIVDEDIIALQEPKVDSNDDWLIAFKASLEQPLDDERGTADPDPTPVEKQTPSTAAAAEPTPIIPSLLLEKLASLAPEPEPKKATRFGENGAVALSLKPRTESGEDRPLGSAVKLTAPSDEAMSPNEYAPRIADLELKLDKTQNLTADLESALVKAQTLIVQLEAQIVELLGQNRTEPAAIAKSTALSSIVKPTGVPGPSPTHQASKTSGEANDQQNRPTDARYRMDWLDFGATPGS